MKKKIIGFFAIFLISFFFISAKPGKERNYTVLPENALIKINGEEKKLVEFVKKYLPHIYLNQNYESPDLLFINYEVIEKEHIYILRLHLEWEDEFVPNNFLDFLYRIIRRIIYGPSNNDIEFLQLNIDKNSEKINQILFETKEEKKNYHSNQQTHLIVDIKKENEIFIKSIHRKKNREIILQENLGFSISNHIHLESVTWNHLMEIIEQPHSELQLLNYEIQYLDDESYRKKRYAKRSQADFRK